MDVSKSESFLVLPSGRQIGTDADFDSYWEDESRNKNRNRIRVGRQYQATLPSLLKPGEADGRKCEDLETLKWKPDNNLSDQQVDQYLSVAKAVSLFAKAIDKYQNSGKASDKCLQSALRGLSEFVTSHHPCHHDAGCQVPSPSHSGSHSAKHSSTSSEWTPAETKLFAEALDSCGKNFGAIKKDYLPWKPVKSIIEYYYQGKGEKSSSPSEPLDKLECTNSTMTPTEGGVQLVKLKDEPVEMEEEKDTQVQGDSEVKDQQDDQDKSKLLSSSVLSDPGVKSECESLPVPSASDAGLSTLGSLKFYLGGRLVLKLNAQQESGSSSQKCTWVQSVDTPKIPSASRKVKKYKKKAAPEQTLPFFECDDEDPGAKDTKENDSDSLSMDLGESEECSAKKAKLKRDSSSSSLASWDESSSVSKTAHKKLMLLEDSGMDSSSCTMQLADKKGFKETRSASPRSSVTSIRDVKLVKSEVLSFIKKEPSPSPHLCHTSPSGGRSSRERTPTKSPLQDRLADWAMCHPGTYFDKLVKPDISVAHSQLAERCVAGSPLTIAHSFNSSHSAAVGSSWWSKMKEQLEKPAVSHHVQVCRIPSFGNQEDIKDVPLDLSKKRVATSEPLTVAEEVPSLLNPESSSLKSETGEDENGCSGQRSTNLQRDGGARLLRNRNSLLQALALDSSDGTHLNSSEGCNTGITDLSPNPESLTSSKMTTVAKKSETDDPTSGDATDKLARALPSAENKGNSCASSTTEDISLSLLSQSFIGVNYGNPYYHVRYSYPAELLPHSYSDITTGKGSGEKPVDLCQKEESQTPKKVSEGKEVSKADSHAVQSPFLHKQTSAIPPWLAVPLSPYLQMYSQFYSYYPYFGLGTSPQHVSSGSETPLDLSSATEKDQMGSVVLEAGSNTKSDLSKKQPGVLAGFNSLSGT